jgi:endo-1,4-beta-xylanase
MKRQLLRPAVVATILFFIAGCSEPEIPVRDIGSVSIATKYAGYFPIGAAVGNWHLSNVRNILDFHFDRLVCENAMKWQALQPTQGNYNWTEADAVANYARARGIKLTGHTLIWHNQAPGWIFADLPVDLAARQTELRLRMKTHIDAVVARYDDVVDNWDVVNEAINDNGTWRQSNWFTSYGDEGYIYWAFRYTRDALEANGGPGYSQGKLYYNDYNMLSSNKINAVLNMINWLKGAAIPDPANPITVDGVGEQAHWNLTWPARGTIETAFTAFKAAGLKIKVSELDISIYADDYSTNPPTYEAQKPFSAAIEAGQAARYGELFDIFRDFEDAAPGSDDITSITLWGVSDDKTWLDTWPVTRNNYPLLFDDDHYRKPAYDAVVNF